jgi:hypothetical protein
MTFDDKQLEEIRAGEKWLARFDSPAPDAALIERTKAATRHAADEMWLAEISTPQPDARKLAGVKAAVRAELAAESQHLAWKRHSSLLFRTAGVLSAAAVIALAVGVIYFAPSGQQPTAVARAAPEEPFVESLDAVLDEVDPQLVAIEEALGSLESVSDWPGSYSSGSDGDLTDIDQQIDTLGTVIDDLFETS